MFTEAGRKNIREWCEKATSGPWYTVELPWLQRGAPTWVIAGSPDPHVATPICDAMEIMEWEEGEEPTYTQSDIDMEFIANARQWVPELLNDLENFEQFAKKKFAEYEEKIAGLKLREEYMINQIVELRTERQGLYHALAASAEALDQSRRGES